MRAIIMVLAASTGLLVAISAAQWHQKSKLAERLAASTQEADQKQKQLEDLQAARAHDDQERVQLSRVAADLEEQIRTQQLTASLATTGTITTVTFTNLDAAKPDKAGLGNFLSKMMQDPNTRRFIRDQQRMMMDQMYAPLLKQLGLTADESSQFKDLLADNTTSLAEKATSMFGGSATNRADLAGEIAADQKTFDEQIKAFLGEDRFAKYKEYQETVADRTQLTQFKQQSSSSDYPISDLQTEQLLAFIKEERRNVAAATGQNLPGSGQDRQNLEAMLSSEQADKLLQSQETVNQRVFERARTILSPDQLQSFATFQTNQMQMMRMGLSMARRFLGPDPTQNSLQDQNP